MTEPTTPHSAERPRYASLHDYLRVIRRRRRLILVVTLAFTAVALLVSLNRNPVYQASAQLQFLDPLQNLQLVGSRVALPEQGSAARAATNAQLVTRPQVTERVQKMLHANLSAGELRGAITTRVGVQTGLVELDARTGSATLSASIANGYAEAVRRAGTRAALHQLSRIQSSIEDELRVAQQANPPTPVRVSTLQTTLSQLRALKDVSDPVRIAERAAIPGRPISPDHKRDVVLGAGVGLIFGLIAAFVLDSLDRRFRSAHEIEEQLGMPVLGRVSAAAFAHPGLAGNGYAMEEGEFEAFRVLRMNLSYLAQQEPLRSVLVTSSLPEEGKSTVSVSLASAVALTGQRVLLVECDLRRPSFTHRLGIARQPGLTDYLLGTATPQDILQTVDLSAPRSLNGAGATAPPGPAATLVCIAAGTPVSTAPELLVSDRFRDFLAKVAKVYDLIVLDASPLLAVSDPLELVPQVDGVLVCVRAQQTTHEQARASRAALDNLPARPMGVVLTGISSGDPDAYDYYYGS